MKYCLFICLTFVSLSMCGQKYAKENIEKYDTVGCIKILSPTDQKIVLKKKDIEFRFSKDSTIAELQKIIAERELVNEHCKNAPENSVLKNTYIANMRDISDFKKIISYLKKSENITLKFSDPNKPYEQIKNDIPELTSFYLTGVFYCDLIDSGNFNVLKNGVLQTKINKVKVTYSDAVAGTSDIVYMLVDGERVWTCPSR